MSFHAEVAGLHVELAWEGEGERPDALARWAPFACAPGRPDVSLALRPGKLETDGRYTGFVRRLDGLWRAEGLHAHGWLDPVTGRGEATADPALLVADTLVRAALARSVAARGGVLVHAASVRVDGAGHLVPGRSGAGKSTLSSLAGHVLADELSVVLPGGDGYEVHGSPWWRSAGGSAPLAAVHALDWADPALAPLPRAALLRHLAAAVVLPLDGPDEREAAFRACGAVAAVVPFSRLSFRLDTDVDALLRGQARRAA